MILRSIMIAAGIVAFAAMTEAAGAADFRAAAEPSARTEACCEPYRFVYAEFWYGNRKVVAPVRHSPAGDEVELPGGIWVPCQFSCEVTLRKQTLDYLENQGAGSGSESTPGYPRADSYVDGWGYRHGYLF